MPTSLDDTARQLLQSKNFAHLAVTLQDGSIQSVVVWADVDDQDRIVVNSAEGRDWPRNVRRNGGATISVHDQENPYTFTSVVTKLVEDTHDGADAQIDALAKKYMDLDSYPYRQEGEVRVTLALEPVKVTSRS